MNAGPETGHLPVPAALWGLTPGGLTLSRRLAEAIHGTISHGTNDVSVFVSRRMKRAQGESRDIPFDRLADAVAREFYRFRAHIFFMSTGITVRMISPHLRHKTEDPAVVAVDDAGRFAVSLVSGHLGGANHLARFVGEAIGAVPVITTATDANDLPSIDLIARERGLVIENPEAIKFVNMAFLERRPVRLMDPYGLLEGRIPASMLADRNAPEEPEEEDVPAVLVDDRICKAGTKTLRLRPRSLSVGIGCNRGTPESEIRDLLERVCRTEGLAPGSIRNLATIDIKNDEIGILALTRTLGLPLEFYSRDALNQVQTIENPSAYAEKHTGARSVCEAAAILASRNGTLIVPKKKTRNVTIALARAPEFCPSQAWDRDRRTICRPGPWRSSARRT